MAAASSPVPSIQSQVLQTTLAEITSTRATVSSTSPAAAAAAPDCCVICLEEVSEPSTALPCAHTNFDFICLTNWLAVDAKCPLCKAAVLQVRYTDSTGLKTYTVPPVASASSSSSSSSSTTANSTPVSLRSSQTTFQHYFLNRNRPGRNSHNNNRPRHPAPSSRTRPPTPSSALLRRRHIYTHNLYSLHVGSNPLSRYRSGPTPADFLSDPDLVSRARTFIRRELQVFSFLSDPAPPSPPSTSPFTPSTIPTERAGSSSSRRANNAEFLLEYTIAILKTVDMQGAAGQAEEMLSDFLGRDSARLFLHELRAWLRSPCLSLEAWDRGVQYPDPDRDAGSRGGNGDGFKRAREREEGQVGEIERQSGRGRDGRGRETGRGGRHADAQGARRKGDYWRPGHRRFDYEGGKRRRTGEGRVEVGG